MNLRPYQEEAVKSAFKKWQTCRSILLDLPTGTGKTVVFSAIIEKWLERSPNDRVLVLAHRQELLEQARDKLKTFTGIDSGLEKAQSTASEKDRVVVASVQSMKTDKRLRRYDPDSFNLIIIDEAHHSTAKTYTRLIDYFADAKILGVTATPDRSDKKNIGSVFEEIAYRYDLAKAIKDGFLSPIVCTQIPLRISLRRVKTRAGDFDDRGLDHAIRPYFHAIIESMRRECRDRKIVVFLPLIQTAIDFSNLLNEEGFRSAAISGQTKPDERKKILEDFEAGKYNVLCNAMLLTEGWDCPSVDCVVPLRPTQSRSLYCQMIGRGTRLHEGKENLLVLDYLWLTNKKHRLSKKTKLKRPVDLFVDMEALESATPEQAEEMLEGVPEEISFREEREAILSAIIAQNENNERVSFNPVDHDLTDPKDPLHYFFVMDEKVKGADCKFEEPDQMTVDEMKRLGFKKILPTMDKKTATKIIAAERRRKREGKSSYKQVRILKSKGFIEPEKWTREEASRLIGIIQGNNWRVPFGIDPQTYRPDQDHKTDLTGLSGWQLINELAREAAYGTY